MLYAPVPLKDPRLSLRCIRTSYTCMCTFLPPGFFKERNAHTVPSRADTTSEKKSTLKKALFSGCCQKYA